MRIQDLMSTKVATVTVDMTMKQVAAVLHNSGLNGAAVIDEQGKMIGWVEAEQIIAALVEGSASRHQAGWVQSIMKTDVATLQGCMTIKKLQLGNNVSRQHLFPVLDTESKLIGVLKQSDLVRYLSDSSLLLAGKMRTVMDSLYNGVLAVDEAGTVTLMNDAAEVITGLTRDVVLGQPIDQIIPNTGLRRVLITGIPELSQQQNIGHCRIVTNRSPILKGNKIIGAVAVFQDITELKEVAAELENVKNLKRTLESAIESLFEGIVIVDRHGIITMINQAYGDFLGIEPLNAIGRHVAEVIPNTRMHLVAQGGKAEITEIQKIKEHNNSVVTRMPIIKDGETVGAVGKMLFKDVKDIKMLANKLNKLQFEVEYYKEELFKAYGGKYTIESIIGGSEKMVWLKSLAVKSAKGSSTVLILGESGTGKEIFAHAIHNAGGRQKGPFIKINCAAVPENLLESELFGYDEGAFTGARKGGKPGKFELANGGTVFLDEIGDMPLAMQAKLLRVLQEKEIERVGGTKTIKIDVRVIAATNRNLDTMIEQGTFRQDLYYRLNIITINIPPLRERREDIPVLCDFLLKKINVNTQHSVEGIAPEVMEYLLEYNWPGNVRELENVLERAVNLMDDEGQILPEHLPPLVKKTVKVKVTDEDTPYLANMMGDAEKQAICKALAAAGGNKSKAAKILGIHRSGFYQKMQKYNIQ